jgi:hypothetical protein
VRFGDDEAVDTATAYLRGREDALGRRRPDSANADVALVASVVRDSMVASADESGEPTEPQVRHVTVVFRQTVNGIATIGTGGVVEVTLTGDREVCRVRSVLRDIAAVTSEGPSFDVASLQRQAEESALAEVLAQPNVDGATVVKSEFGLFSADESIAQSSAEPSIRVLVEMRTGPFSRLVEKVYPARELSGS